MECVVTRLSRTQREAFSPGRGRNFSPVRTARYGVRRRYRARVAAKSCGTTWRTPTSPCPCAYAGWCPRSSRPSPWTRRPAVRSRTSRRRRPPSWSGRRGGSRPRCRTRDWRRTANASSPGRWPRSSGGRAGWPASPCRSAGRCASVWASPWRRASRTPTERPTASWPPCCPGLGSVGERLAAHRRRDAVPSDRLGARRPRAVGRTARPRRLPVRPGRRRRRVPARRRRPVERAAGLRRWRPLGRAGQHGRALGRGRLPRLVAHEAYPGHHVECSRGETRRRSGSRRAGGDPARLAAGRASPRGSPSAGSARPSGRAGDRGRPAFSRPPVCRSTVDSPSGSIPS